MNLNYTNIFMSSLSSLAVHVMPDYSYKFDKYTPVFDGHKYIEKIFPIKLKKRGQRCTCNRRTERVTFSTLIMLIIVS